jgi:hypothetical protein
MPRERESLPVTFYRVLVELPCIVAFRSAVFEVHLESIPAASRYELTGDEHARAKSTIIGPSYRSIELLTEAVFKAGVPVRVDTVGATIMRRMVSESRAVVVAPPADDPSKRWVAANEPLYQGEDVRLKFRRVKKLPEM